MRGAILAFQIRGSGFDWGLSMRCLFLQYITVKLPVLNFIFQDTIQTRFSASTRRRPRRRPRDGITFPFPFLGFSFYKLLSDFVQRVSQKQQQQQE